MSAAGSGAAAAGGGGPLQPLDARQERKDVLVAKRLGDEIEGPQPHRLDGHRDAAVGGHHDHFHVGQRALLDPLQQLDAVELGHFQVGHHDVEASACNCSQASRPSAAATTSWPCGGQVVRQGDALDLFVVDNEDFHTARQRLG